MLCFARKQGQAILIDGRIRVLVYRHTARSVKLAIEAPADVEVHREEVHVRKLVESSQAGGAGLTILAARGQEARGRSG
jgi:carbon storage regulator